MIPAKKKLTDKEKEEINEYYLLLQSLEEGKKYNRLAYYRPYEKAKSGGFCEQHDYHVAGLNYKYRALMGGNRSGKTEALVAEDCIHMCNYYDQLVDYEWPGKRYNGPLDLLLIGLRREQIRGSLQMKLIGSKMYPGTGMIPKHILDRGRITWMKDDNDCVDQIFIPWPGDPSWKTENPREWNSITIKTQHQGPKAIQGFSGHAVRFDEFPEETRVFDEARARIIDLDGDIGVSATPETGVTDVALEFQNDETGLFWCANMDVQENPFLPKNFRDNVFSYYPRYLWAAKIYGLPVSGEGMIFPIMWDEIRCEPFDISKKYDWEFIAGIDLGFANSWTVIVWMCRDPILKTVYIFDCEMVRKKIAQEIAPLVKKWDRILGFDIPVAWPLDAKAQERSSGAVIRDIYVDLNVNMISTHAHFSDGRNTDVDAGNELILEWMRSERFKVMDTPNLQGWMQEQKTYHKDMEGKIKKTNNCQFDRMDATRYAAIMLHEGHGETMRKDHYYPVGTNLRAYGQNLEGDINYSAFSGGRYV